MAYITKQTSRGGKTHVYECSSYRVKGEKNPKLNKRFLGVLDDTSKELILAKNIDNLPTETLELLSKYEITFNGKKAEKIEPKKYCRPTGVIEEAIYSSKTFDYGISECFQKLSDEIKLVNVLNETFEEDFANQIYHVACYEVATGNVLNCFQEWIQEISTSKEIASSPAAMTRLCDYLGNNQPLLDKFFENWFKACDYPESLICDTSSISSYSQNIDNVEWGYNRDKENLKQINLNMVYASETDLPLFYRVIDGSISDVVTLITTAKIINNLGIKNFALALDRGFFSKENLEFLNKKRLNYTIGVPISNNKEAQRVIDNLRPTLKNPLSSIEVKGKNYYYGKGVYNFYDGKKNILFSNAAHVYLDPIRQREEKEDLDKYISDFSKLLHRTKFKNLNEAKKFLDEKVNTQYRSIFAVEKTAEIKKEGKVTTFIQSGNKSISLYIIDSELEKVEQNFGIFMILNSKSRISGIKTLLDNKSRDLQEKVFDILKNSTGNNRLHVAKNSTMAGKLFLAFIALIIHKALENKMKDTGLLKKYSVQKCLEICKGFKVVKLKTGEIFHQEISLKTKIVFEILFPGLLSSHGVKMTNVISKVKQLRKTCSNVKA